MPTPCYNCGKETSRIGPKYNWCSPECVRIAARRERAAVRSSWTEERKKAYQIVARAIRRGDLLQQPCEACGSLAKIRAHHDDYSKPLDVRWLCQSCHRRHHAKFGSALNAFIS